MRPKTGNHHATVSKTPKQDDLEMLLRDTPVDEKQGVSATLGFTYQQWWATLAVVELLKKSNDFAVGMELKEDVALLDSLEDPKLVEFCQIKKNEQAGAWTLKELHKKGAKGKAGKNPPSVLAKLYSRRHEFNGHETELRFVSNVGFKVPNEADGNSHTSDEKLENLTAAQQDVVKSELGSQLGIDASKIDLKNFHLHRSNLPIGEPEVFVGGKLSELVASGVVPFELTETSVAARVLASELQSRASNTSYARNFQDLKKRILTRKDALEVLTKVSKAKPVVANVIDQAIEQLRGEALPFLALKEIQSERINVCAHSSDRTNATFRDAAIALLKAQAKIIKTADPASKLSELMKMTVEEARISFTQSTNGLSNAYLNVIALMVLNDGINEDILAAATSQKPEAEK
jgi:hypothetical protein